MRNVIVLVEGYHDRAFLAGWLAHRGWSDPGLRDDGQRKRVTNPITGESVAGGRYAFQFEDHSFCEIVPQQGSTNLIRHLEDFVKRVLPHDKPDDIVVVLDVDGSDSAAAQSRRTSVEDAIKRGTGTVHACKNIGRARTVCACDSSSGAQGDAIFQVRSATKLWSVWSVRLCTMSIRSVRRQSINGLVLDPTRHRLL